MLPVAGCGARVSRDLMALHGEWLIKGEKAVTRGERLKGGVRVRISGNETNVPFRGREKCVL